MPRARLRPADVDPELTRWPIPIEVEASRDARRLEWRYRPTRPVRWRGRQFPAVSRQAQGMRRVARATAPMLRDFLEFGARPVPASGIAAFAERFGVFHHHGEPGGEGYDDVARWRAKARLFGAILSAAEDVRAGAVGSDEHWGILKRAAGARAPTLASGVFLWVVQEHVAEHVRVAVSSRSERGAARLPVVVTIGGGSLEGALCAELLRELQSEVGRLVACGGGCGRVVPLVQGGRRAFCQPCRRRGLPIALAKRDYRARALAAQRTR